MNGRERYLAMIRGQPCDHVPRSPILMRFAAEHINQPFSSFCADPDVKVRGNLSCAETFGCDVVGVMSDPYAETAALGGTLRFHQHDTPECTHPPLADSTNLDQLPDPDPTHAPRTSASIHALAEYQRLTHNTLARLGWVEGPIAQAANLRGIQHLMLDLYDDPQWVAELMDRCVTFAIRYAQAQISAGADVIGIGDALASQISPDLYESLIQPRQQQLAQAIADTGTPVRMHICGDITHLLPGLAHVPLNIIDVDHMVDLATVRQTLPDHVAIGANLDPVNDVLHGDPDTIRRLLTTAHQTVGNPFIANAGCEIPPGTPAANLHALCQPLPYDPA